MAMTMFDEVTSMICMTSQQQISNSWFQMQRVLIDGVGNYTYEKKDYMVVCEVGKTGSSREPPNVRIPILRLRYTRTVSLVLYLSTLTDKPSC